MDMKNDLLKLGNVKNLKQTEKFLPLYANRGVSNSVSLENPSFNMCIDWVTVSFNYDSTSFHNIFRYFNLDPFDYIETKGTFNIQYSYMRTYREFIKVYLPENYMHDQFARCCMELSGQACRLLETLNDGIYFWCPFFCMIHALNGKCSRCDLAIDDFKGEYFTIMDLFQKVMKGEYTCLSNTWNVVAKGTRSDEDYSETGFTIYLGSNSSERQLCIYNKKAERLTNGYETFADYWVRYELRLKKETANTFLNNYLINVDFWNDFAAKVSELYYGFIEFKDDVEKEDLHNRSRCKVWQPWIDFLGATEKLIIKNQAKIESSISVKKTWYQANYSNFMNEIALSDLSGFNSYMDNTLLEKINDFDKRRLDRVNNYRLLSKQNPLTSLEFFSYINNLRIKNGLELLTDDEKFTWKCKLFPEELGVIR